MKKKRSAKKISQMVLRERARARAKNRKIVVTPHADLPPAVLKKNELIKHYTQVHYDCVYQRNRWAQMAEEAMHELRKLKNA